MFWNNVKIAIRNLRKNKLFALINILGLALGMTIFVFGNLLVRYEQTHDAFFANADRICGAGAQRRRGPDQFGVDGRGPDHRGGGG
jgi:putative ABC transport system permease protein